MGAVLGMDKIEIRMMEKRSAEEKAKQAGKIKAKFAKYDWFTAEA